MPLGQDMAVMRQPGSPVDQPVAQRLVDSDGTFRSVQAYRPRGCELRFRRKVQTQGNAELALLPVDMLLQVGATQVRREINIRRLDCFSYDVTDCLCNLVMEEARNALVVGRIAVVHSARRRAEWLRAGWHAGSSGATLQD